MAHDHHDEEVLGKPYDARLVKRLLRYVRPYVRYVVVAVIILVFVAGFELALPYITRMAIDDYIVATARVVSVDVGEEERGAHASQAQSGGASAGQGDEGLCREALRE